MLLNLTCLALSALAGATPAPAARAVADSPAVLTVEALTHMTTFWASFVKEPDSIKTTGRKTNHQTLPLTIGQQQMTLPSVVNMVAMAAKYPTVAADLKQASLTAQEWQNYREALLTAWIAQKSGAASSIPATSALGKNLAFLNSHKTEFDALRATGMWFPAPPQQQGGGGGGGGDDLQD